MKLFSLLFIPLFLNADVQWTRLKGIVRSMDHKAQKVTIQNADGDLFTVTVTPDVHISDGKTDAQLMLKDIHLDEKVTLISIPEPDKPIVKEETFEEMNASGQPR